VSVTGAGEYTQNCVLSYDNATNVLSIAGRLAALGTAGRTLSGFGCTVDVGASSRSWDGVTFRLNLVIALPVSLNDFWKNAIDSNGLESGYQWQNDRQWIYYCPNC
jgi:hypothetical protein